MPCVNRPFISKRPSSHITQKINLKQILFVILINYLLEIRVLNQMVAGLLFFTHCILQTRTQAAAQNTGKTH
jgi:hypothetical protein